MILICRVIDGLSDLLGLAGRLVIFVLIIAMLYEVVARYVFNAPTLWAFDISYMLNGSVFLLGAAYALRKDAHVRIDFLSQKLPVRFQQYLNGAIYLLVMAPLVLAFAWIATQKALKAFSTGEVESVSPWAPLVWPFYGVIALGLFVFSLQFISEALKYLSGHKRPDSSEGELEGAESDQ
ncbi:TRAP transporter small permease subunit [Roseibium sp. SCPC15]|uniref:TRAP transporter small permease subunit n=1 Tax=Roseibium sp. SCP15 TaxID=3141376 RepID=UPI00333555A7